ncbi:MAG TPA: amidohydrolase family protein [Pyrinomonadaceae bacterium]|jgi:imidazolonepropionase-like amidohydrolase
MKKLITRSALAVFAFISLCALSVAAQVSGSFAITNARVVTVSGATIERGTIVIRDGLIESVGENARVPADARVFDGTGLTVYPGFFDSNTNLGLPQPRPPGQPQQQQAQQTTQSNSNYPNGLQPETSALEALKAGEAQFETPRNNGFTTVLTVSRDGIFNGQSAVINLAGETVSSMVVKSPFAQHITFRTLPGGVYPTALIGTFSAIRQMLLDAQRLEVWQKNYAANPRGMKRPDSDKSLEALLPVLNRQMPIVFNAGTEREIVRALDLAKEFNLRAIISGGGEAWKVAGRLKEQNVPVLLSLNFPKRTTAASPDADPEDLDVLRLRAETPKGAARLAQAGVKFAFQSGGMTNITDFWTNANLAIENGLNKDAAIRAMTLGTAEIFGVENRLGSIEQGKIANLIVSRGDIFSKDKAITHVFVDGKLFEQKPAVIKALPTGTSFNGGLTPTAPKLDISGAWNITVQVSGQSVPVTLNFKQEGEKLSGNVQSGFFGTAQIRNGSATGDSFRFDVTVDVGGQNLELVFSGKVSGAQISGTATSQQGATTFSGAKVP